MRGATGRTKRPGRRNKGPGAESSGGQRVKTKRTGLGAPARRDRGDGPEEQSCAGLGGRAGDRRRGRRAAGTAPAGPALPAALTPAPAGLAAAAARPHAPEPEPRRRRAGSARHTPPPPRPAHATPPPRLPDAKRAAALEPAARRGLLDARNFPGSLRSDSPRLTLSQQAPSSTNSRQNSNPREIPPTPSLVPLPRPFPFSSLLDSTQPPRSFSPRSSRKEPDASHRQQLRGSSSLPSLETYPSDGACAGGSSAGEPSIWSIGSAPVIRVLGRALRDVRGD